MIDIIRQKKITQTVYFTLILCCKHPLLLLWNSRSCKASAVCWLDWKPLESSPVKGYNSSFLWLKPSNNLRLGRDEGWTGSCCSCLHSWCCCYSWLCGDHKWCSATVKDLCWVKWPLPLPFTIFWEFRGTVNQAATLFAVLPSVIRKMWLFWNAPYCQGEIVFEPTTSRRHQAAH